SLPYTVFPHRGGFRPTPPNPTTATASYCTHGGFTLIEILVALAIVAIALGAVVAESSHYIASMVRMQDRTIAHWVAMDRITEQQLLGTWPGPNESNGSVHLAGRDWHWSMRIIATPDDSIRRVDVDVSADDHRDRVDATAIAYLERPAQ
ncbi:MAG: type II secretion system minor pseudopilin GspI, partial [Chromatiales bacterium]|nr:type II secretion system minor pseudopilin GspI [Chromatiales bacterium]